jgi:hypothetical protein
LSGAGEASPSRPTVYSVSPEQKCERIRLADKPHPTVLGPPSPGLRAVALSSRRIRVYWWFSSFPSACRPEAVLVGVLASRERHATPETMRERVGSSRRGSVVLTYCDCLQPPDVALAGAYAAHGLASRTVKVLIRR